MDIGWAVAIVLWALGTVLMHDALAFENSEDWRKASAGLRIAGCAFWPVLMLADLVMTVYVGWRSK